jgi:integrase
VTKLLERMRGELVRRNYAANTIHSYLRIVKDFQEYAHKPLNQVGADDLRRYHTYLLEERKLAVRSVVQRVAAVRFLYCKTLKRRDMKEDLPYPRNYRRRLPVILSPEEVGRLIDSARNLFHRAMIMTLYACGLRRTEAARLKVSDIDSQRMMIRVTQGKGGVDRDVPLSPALLDNHCAGARFSCRQTCHRVPKPVRASIGSVAPATSFKSSHRKCRGPEFLAVISLPIRGTSDRTLTTSRRYVTRMSKGNRFEVSASWKGPASHQTKCRPKP